MNEKYIEESIDKILSSLPTRSRNVLEKRFGLKKGEKRHTLESIGQEYGITRERVRQIEKSAKEMILNTKELISHSQKIVKELEKAINNMGGILAEKDLLENFTSDKDKQDHLHFFLNLADPFYDTSKSEYNDKIWYTDHTSYDAFEKSLDKLYKDLDTNDLLTEKEIIEKFHKRLSEQTDNKKLLKNDVVKSLINLSKKIGSNKLDQWGRSDSRNIATRGVKDLAFLILNEYQRPMHFREISEIISEKFEKKINVVTVHNELIKDDRFILIGRGQYGLSSWDKFSGGTVKDVIVEILEKAKRPLSRDEIIEEVLDKKNVRKQTIIVNLSSKNFNKNKDGKFVSKK